MNWEIWIPLFIAVSAWIPKILEWLANRNQSNAEFANTIMEGGTKAIAAVTKILDEYQEHNAELKKEIEDIKAARVEREKQIEELKSQIENLNRDYAKATADLQAKYEKSKSAIQKLVKALQENDPPIPIPDLNGDLTESVHKWKWPSK